MNKMYSLLQATAVSLLLIAGSHAGSASAASADKATVVAAGTHARSSHRKPSGKPMMKVDVNSADAATINKALINIGPSKAAAIVAWRKQHGAFKSADQLAEVKGVGLKTVEKNRDRIVIGTVARR